MNLSNLFRPVEAAEAPQTFDSERDAYCSCPAAGKSRDVLVTIDDGQVYGIACAHCKKPLLFGGMEDDFDAVYAENLPMVMTTVVKSEYVHDYTYESYEAHELTFPEREAS
jgi:hypothetical protein